jgi:hypothetical protein
VIPGLLAALLLALAAAYLRQMAVAGNPGRHREPPQHPGWESEPEDLESLQGARHRLSSEHPAYDTAYTELLSLRGSVGGGQ